MVYESTKVWLETLDITGEVAVLANLALGLAKSYDDEHNTSTAAELRKTVGEIKRLVAAATAPVLDPIEELLKR